MRYKFKDIIDTPTAVVTKSRYERKFHSLGVRREGVETILKLNPYNFREVFHERQINSVYFDTEDLSSYMDNINGVPNRRKFRIRWYGDNLLKAENPNIEIKMRNGLVGGKLVYPVTSFDTCKLSDGSYEEVLLNSEVPDTVKMKVKYIRPVIIISYTRKYFVSADGKYRITIDSDLKYQQPTCSDNSGLFGDSRSCIIELKYGLEEDSCAGRVMSHLRFRISRSSKYVMGMESLLNSWYI